MSEFDRDCWRTPPEVFAWLDSMFRFTVDLAANRENALTPVWIDPSEDALSMAWDWHGPAFCNPPYSNIMPWVKQAADAVESENPIVMLLPSPNGEDYHRVAMESADELILIHGRLAFLKPDGTPVPGNTRGSCVYVFRPSRHTASSEIRLRHISRDWIYRTYGKQVERAA